MAIGNCDFYFFLLFYFIPVEAIDIILKIDWLMACTAWPVYLVSIFKAAAKMPFFKCGLETQFVQYRSPKTNELLEQFHLILINIPWLKNL